jgi:hypothetical protein
MSVVNSTTQLSKVAAPNLPLAPEEYASRYQEQLNNVLRLYFNRLDNLVSQLSTDTSDGIFTNINLVGTGQNLFWSTTTFGTGWGIGSGTNTLSTATLDPFNGTSVYKLVANAAFDPNTGSSAILSFASANFPVGAIYTQSIYFKAAEANALRIRNNSSGEIYTFTIGTTPVATGGVLNPQLIAGDNGWYRAVWTFPNGNVAGSGRSDVWSLRLAITGDGTSGIYISSPQLEYGTTANTYIPNTTGASIYGTPTISFDGVASIALDSKGNLILQPATGAAIQAQATTSTAVGGNARGANAVDFQTARSSSTQVASGSYSVISGGQRNASPAIGSFTGGGWANVNNGYEGVIAGGSTNGNTGFQSFIGGGANNVTSSSYAVMVAGYANTSGGVLNFIGGGFTNSGTAAAAVTTQSATMNGTTAVTLSAPNGSIRVGQYISGTSIAGFTYVAAISGTSLTLSQNASGSSTSTLSFYTPHGVVVGGGNNQATGSYSFIGGGGDAGTAANRNVASGAWSTVGGGTKNVASGTGSVIAGGGFEFDFNFGNTASGTSSFVGGGIVNTASNSGASILGGWQNNANGGMSTVVGGRHGTTRGITGSVVFTASDIPIENTNGLNQAALLVLAKQTTDATPTRLCSNQGAASTNNQVILPNNSAYFFTGEVVSGVTGGGNSKGWKIEGLIKRGANAAATTLVGSTVTSPFGDAGAAGWVIAVTADTTNGGLAVTFTGQVATTIRTVAQIRTTEMTY